MIEAIALRHFRRNGEEFAKDQLLKLDEGAFDDLAGVGLVDRAPGAPEPQEPAPEPVHRPAKRKA